jgi:hypothetical protein
LFDRILSDDNYCKKLSNQSGKSVQFLEYVIIKRELILCFRLFNSISVLGPLSGTLFTNAFIYGRTSKVPDNLLVRDQYLKLMIIFQKKTPKSL